MWKQYPVLDIPKETWNWCAENDVHPLFVPILHRKGIYLPQDLKHFLFDKLADTTPSTAFGENMYKAVSRIKKAVNKGEHIVVYGDYDVDGTTGTATVLSVLKNIQATKQFTFDFMIPSRFTEGYGLNDNSLPRLLEKKPNLVITVDCGITAAKQVTALKHLGIDVIVTDHHNPKGELPHDAVAIVHPGVCNYPFKGLCGCAVAYQLMKGIWETQNLTPPNWLLYDQLDLVALGTVCDMMPLSGDNRIYVREGLARMNAGSRFSIRCMRERFKWNKIDTTTLGFYFGPMINAAGRMKDADTAVQFFTSTNPKESAELVETLYQRNEDRKRTEKLIIEEGLKQALDQPYKNLIVVKGEEFHSGVVGIAAGKIVSTHNKPTFVLHGHGDKIGGSARSVGSINLFEEMKKHEHLLHTWGGHAAAVGLQVFKSNEHEFFSALDNELSQYPADVWNTVKHYDNEITSYLELNASFFRTLKLLEPFGQNFPTLNWKMKGAIVDGKELSDNRKVGKIQVGNVKKSFAMWANGDKAVLDRDQDFYGKWEWNDKYGEIQFVALDAELPKRPKLTLTL